MSSQQEFGLPPLPQSQDTTWATIDIHGKSFQHDYHISIIKNKVYFSGNITRDSMHYLIAELTRHEQYLQSNINSLKKLFGQQPCIYLIINSNYGYIRDAFFAADHIRQMNIPIHTIISGTGDINAIILLLAAKKRYIMPNSYVLMSGIYDNQTPNKSHTQNDKDANLQIVSENLRRYIVSNTNIKLQELIEFQKYTRLWDAETCVKYGLVDEIVKL